MNKEIFIDLEWVKTDAIFLLSYAYSLSEYGQLYGRELNRVNIKKLVDPVEWIFVYGPDIGKMETVYGLQLKANFYTVNLLGVARKFLPLRSFRLNQVEGLFGIERQVDYKENIGQLYRDFKNPKTHKEVLKYNMEDALNLVRVKRELMKREGLTNKDLLPYVMKPK
jgi:hypothetical protein